MPNQGDIYFFELYLEEDLKNQKLEASYLLSEYMKRSPIRYFQLTKEWQEKEIDYSKVLDMKENSGLTDEEIQCIKTDNVTKLDSYMKATQAYLDNIGELHMPQHSESIPV